MAKSVLKEAYFHDEAAAFAALEAIMWPNGPTCPHCGACDRINRLEGVKDKKGRVRLGLWKCYHCRGQFTVRKGTIFESSHLKLYQWFQACFLMCSSKKGVSANQLHRTLGCTLKTAWFVAHRLREAMRTGGLAPLGGEGKVCEADETYWGRVANPKTTDERGRPFRGSRRGRGPANKNAIVALVERGGKVRSFHVETANRETVERIVAENIAKESKLYTDESHLYTKSTVPGMVALHDTVQHSTDEYVRGDVHSNTVEGYFSVFKRGMRGVYQRCGERHLHRYLAEFDFRYNNRSALGVEDMPRTVAALRGAAGKRLTYRDSLG